MTPAEIPAPAPSVRPVLPRGVRIVHDRIRDRWVLLAPERALMLDQTGFAVLREVDGNRTLAEIAGLLAERYEAPPDLILRDATRFISALWARRIVDLR